MHAVPLAAVITFADLAPSRSPNRASSTFTNSPRLVYQRFVSIVVRYGSNRSAQGKDARYTGTVAAESRLTPARCGE
jgi:hypothetical protein